MNYKPRKYEVVSGILAFLSWCSCFNFGRAVEISFDGNGYLWHKLKPNENAMKRHPLKLSMWFKTKHPSGLLVAANYQDDDGSMFAVALRDGKLRCIIPSCDLNSTRGQMEITSVTVSDSRWHLASIVQQGSVLTCQVDGFSKNITVAETGLNGLMFIGGVPRRTLNQSMWRNPCLSVVKNFSGCLGDVFLRNEYIDDILRRHYITQGSRSVCDHSGSGLMSLQDPKSVLIWQIQNTTPTVTSLDFQMRTLLNNGFIAKLSLKQFVLSLFLVEGLIKAKLKLKTALKMKSIQMFSSSKLYVADGRWHRVTCYVTMASKELTLSIDGERQLRKHFPSITTRGQEVASVGLFRIGGSLHQYQYFVGCVREVFINKAYVQPSDQQYILESRNIIMGSCGTTNLIGNADVHRPKMNATEGILKARAFSSSANIKANRTTKYHSKAATSTTLLPMLPHLYAEPNYTMSKSRETNFKTNVTGSSEGANTNSPSSLPYLIAIAALAGVLVLLLVCVLGVCAGFKRFLCFKDSSKRLTEGDTGTDSASKKSISIQAAESETIEMIGQGALQLQTDTRDKHVGLSKNVDELYGTTEQYYSLNTQQARYWRERDEQLLDSQCRQHIENSPVNKHPHVRRSLPPVFQLEATQSPKRRTTTIAAPEVILAVQDKGDTRKKTFASKGTVLNIKDSKVTTDKTSCKTNSKLSHRSGIEVKKPKVAEELPVKKNRRLGYGWAYGSRFARGADSSDTDCSDIERMSSHSRYKYRYGKNSGTFHTGRPLRILEASETEEEQQSNDERARDGQKKKWGRFGKKKKFGTFWDQDSRLLNVLSEEDKNQDMSKLGGHVKSFGETSLTSGQGQQQSSALFTKTDLDKDGISEKCQRRSQNEKSREIHDALPGTPTYIKRGDPDGRPEIPHRLSSLVLPDDTHLGNCECIRDPHHDKSNSSQDYSKSSNVISGRPYPEKCYDVSGHMKCAIGQKMGMSAAVQLNLEGAGCEAGPRQTKIIGGKKKEPKAGAPRLHMRVPKDMLMRRANNLMGGDRPTII